MALPYYAIQFTTWKFKQDQSRCEFESQSGEVYLIQHYVIKFVSDLRHVSGFAPGIPVTSTKKTDHHDVAVILLKVVLNTINQINQPTPYTSPDLVLVRSLLIIISVLFWFSLFLFLVLNVALVSGLSVLDYFYSFL
jgi:hypothetical protein